LEENKDLLLIFITLSLYVADFMIFVNFELFLMEKKVKTAVFIAALRCHAANFMILLTYLFTSVVIPHSPGRTSQGTSCGVLSDVCMFAERSRIFHTSLWLSCVALTLFSAISN
jgi:hypothetical protein